MTGTGFPAVRVRHQRFREALEMTRLLWQGSYRSYDGRYLQLEDARVFDLPDEPPLIAVAGSGPQSAEIAAELGDGLFATDLDAQLVSTWQRLGGHACGPDAKRHLQVAQQYVDAGFDHLVTMNAGPDPDGFIDFFARELSGPLRTLTPARPSAARSC